MARNVSLITSTQYKQYRDMVLKINKVKLIERVQNYQNLIPVSLVQLCLVSINSSICQVEIYTHVTITLLFHVFIQTTLHICHPLIVGDTVSCKHLHTDVNECLIFGAYDFKLYFIFLISLGYVIHFFCNVLM